MPPLSILIKPVSDSCNMRCKYCFYCDEANKRSVHSYGTMQADTLEKLVMKALSAAQGQCTFAFQGGEPTLAGLPFYQEFVRLVQKHNVKKLDVHFAIQTNGTLIDREWAGFLAQNGFLTGLSLDGTKEVNDRFRVDAQGGGTYTKVLHAAQLFDAAGAQYNILTTVTSAVAENVERIYRFFKKNGFQWQQYIACLDPIGERRGGHDYSVTPEQYGVFLKRLFDLWYLDWKHGTPISIRYFDNLVFLLMGQPAEACGMMGHCTCQYVVEADGGVYPCDFYVLDGYRLGDIGTQDFPDFDKKRRELQFIEKSLVPHEDCRACPFGYLCRGGCRRDRDGFDGGPLQKNYLCPAYRAFFPYALPRLQELAQDVMKRSRP